MARLGLLALLLLAFVAVARPPAPAHAAFPGVNGKIAFTSDRDGNSEIYVTNADGSAQANLTNDPASDGGAAGGPAWSPDGSRIAFASDRSGDYEVYVMDFDGSDVVRLTDNPAVDGTPSWSPDGRRIVFSSTRDGDPEIYVMDADGSRATRLTNDPGWDLFPAWSPDGRRIAFHRTQPGDPNDCIPNCVVDVYSMNADGSDVAQLTSNGSSTNPDWSPDGELIAYAYDDGNAPGVYVMSPDESRDLTPDTTQFETQPAWSPDGTTLAYAGGGQDGFDLALMNSDGTGKQRIATVPGNDSFPDWQPRFAGDVSCRDKTNSVDAAIVLQLEARLLDALPCADLADVNGDGRIDGLDAQLVLQFDAGLIDSPPTP